MKLTPEPKTENFKALLRNLRKKNDEKTEIRRNMASVTEREKGQNGDDQQ